MNGKGKDKIPNLEKILCFRNFPLPNAPFGLPGRMLPASGRGKKNRDENIPDLPNLTAYEDYKPLILLFTKWL